jgi:hypothetical protein
MSLDISYLSLKNNHVAIGKNWFAHINTPMTVFKTFTLRMTNSREMGNPRNLQNKIRKQMPRSGQQDVTIWPDLGSTLPHLEIA